MNKRSTVLLLVLVGCGSPKRVDVGDESREVTSNCRRTSKIGTGMQKATSLPATETTVCVSR